MNGSTNAELSTDSGIAVDDLGLRRPSLDDVFLTLTGPQGAGDGSAAAATRGPDKLARG